MRPLTTRQRLTFLFTLYFSIILIILAVMFVAVFRIISSYQTHKDLTLEFTEVVADYVGIDSKGIYFKKDKKGETLRLHLFNDGISAIFFDRNFQVIRNYGLFESSSVNQTDFDNVLASVTRSTQDNKVEESVLSWGQTEFVAFATPMKFDGKVVGSMLLAKSRDQEKEVQQSIMTLMGLLGGTGLIGSYVLGFVFTRRALSPVRAVVNSIEKTHLDELQSKIDLKGNPNDEFVILAQKFNEMLVRLNQMSARQKEFIANASHELRTPLTRAIISLDSALRENKALPPEIGDAKNDLWELNNLLEQLLVLGQVREGALPHGSSDIKKVTAAVIRRYDAELQRQKISVSANISPFQIKLPDEYAKIVLSNLVSNAIKFSSPSSRILITGDDRSRTLSVSDEGVGMTQEELSQLFERFYRGKSVRSSTKGYGLGLSLVKEICDGYGIRLEYESEKGKGTIAKLTF